MRAGGQAAAILSVRCQYCLNVTGFLGVDRTISCRFLAVGIVQVQVPPVCRGCVAHVL